MTILRGWHRLAFVAAALLLVVYGALLYGFPSLPATSPTSWVPLGAGHAGSSSAGDSGSGSGSDSVSDSGNGSDSGSGVSWTSDAIEVPSPEAIGPHPIDRLMAEARATFKALLGTRSLSLEQAAARYRERRGRHPPPGFDAWFAAAQASGAVVVEAFFDRVYDDLAPLWALDPATMRRQVHGQPQVIRVRGGQATFETDNPDRPPWIQHWAALVGAIAPHLPDLDMAVNVMDETRLLVPWETVAEYVGRERAARPRPLPAAADTVATYSGLADVDAANATDAAAEEKQEEPPYQHSWITDDANGFWNHLAAACPPDSPGRAAAALASFAEPVAYPDAPNAAYTRDGFVANATAARDPCLQPHLRGMHGTFVESVSMSTSHALLPLFAGCKLPQNNEILIPGAMYLTDDPFYSGGASHGAAAWTNKTTGLIWRGTASGGRNRADTWWHFHRHRWVQMTNGTTVAAVAAGNAAAGPTFRLLEDEAAAVYANATGAGQGLDRAALGPWLASFADVGFVDLECFPGMQDAEGNKVLTCNYTSPHMAVVPGLPMAQQYDYKYLPDVDGNSYSARWRSFLRSTSTPLKATIYAEWHDDRLVPWVHYVPFDNSYMDLYAVMEYFVGAEPVNKAGGTSSGGHDAVAKRIADESRAWAEAVLRREDMELYVWRLLLEYARVVDDRREQLAYVGDLVDG